MLKFNKKTNGLSFKVHVQPKASKNEIVGVYGDALKVRLTAPPVDGAANKMCLKYLAKCLCIPVSRLEIVSGHSNRTKHVLLKSSDEKTKAVDFKQLVYKVESLFMPKETA
jgi:uncharacterized protein (TIGR00251 family)